MSPFFQNKILPQAIQLQVAGLTLFQKANLPLPEFKVVDFVALFIIKFFNICGLKF